MVAQNPTDEKLDMLRGFEQIYGFDLQQYAGLEGQVAAIADDIAYNNHDIDDGLRVGLIEIADLRNVPFVWEIVEQIKAQYEHLADDRLMFELNRRLITLMIADVHCETSKRLSLLAPQTCDDIRAARRPMVSFSGRFSGQMNDLQTFLRERVYQNKRVKKIMADAETITSDIVRHFMNRPQDLPLVWRSAIEKANINECAADIKDYVAGMTDRYIIELHRSLFDVTPKLR